MTEPRKIGADHPALPGHFPGQPIVPGALLLQCILEAAASKFPEADVAGVRRIKFLRTLSPDEPFWVELGAAGASGVRFHVQTGDGAAADGQLMFKAAD